MALGRKRARMESLELLSPTITRNTAVIIVIGVIVAAVIAGIGVATALITSPAVSSKQCGHTAPIRMFDEESVPKYIIGPGYKVIPVNPTTTEVMVTSCT
jgi:hypothetical protein